MEKETNQVRIPVSVVLLTYNEEGNIRDCLDSVNGWVDEIFVVDSGSTDQSLKIAAEYTEKVFEHPFENYARQRNWAQENLPFQNEWVFHIDADERVSPELKHDLIYFFLSKDRQQAIAGLMVRRRIVFLDRWIKHGGLYPTYHLRIFKAELGRCEEREYDQHFLVDGETFELDSDLIEVTATSLFSWTARHNRWAQKEANYLLNKKTSVSANLIDPRLLGTPIERRRWFRINILEKTPMFWGALIYFFYRYGLRGGFLDGKEGLIYHVLHGFWFRFYVDACKHEQCMKRN